MIGASGANPSLSPLLKWAGGKRAIVNEILPLIKGRGTYYEPFAGGAAVFFSLRPTSAVLADSNPELIECYVQVQRFPVAVGKVLAAMRNDADTYYTVRNSSPSRASERAARFVYLTSLSFNGLYRQNKKGEFNVPYGHKVKKQLPDLTRLVEISSALSGTSLLNGDFEETTSGAKAGDTVYFDPPYTVAHNNNGFVKYNKDIFSWEDQRRLADYAYRLARRGCRVIVSNADHGSIRALYSSFHAKEVERNSVIAANSLFRKTVSELIFYAGPEH